MELPPVEHSWEIQAGREDELPKDFRQLRERLEEATAVFQGDVPELLEEIERICDETNMEGTLYWDKDDDGRIIALKMVFRSRWQSTHILKLGYHEEED